MGPIQRKLNRQAHFEHCTGRINKPPHRVEEPGEWQRPVAMLISLALGSATSCAQEETTASDMDQSSATPGPCQNSSIFTLDSIYAVLAHPGKFNGTRVAVSGFISSNEREAALYPDLERLRLGIGHEAIALGSAAQQALPCEVFGGDITLRGCHEQYVTAIGCFHHNGLPYLGALQPFDEIRPYVRGSALPDKAWHTTTSSPIPLPAADQPPR